MTKTQELLQKRKIKAVRGTIYFRFFFLFVFVGVLAFASQSKLETVLSLTLLVSIFFVELLALFFLSKKKYLNLIGTSGAIIDVVIVTTLPVIWYISVGGKSIPPTYMIKGPLYYAYLFMFLFFNSFAIEPLFTLVNTIGGVLSQIGHLLYLFLEGSTNMTAGFVAHNVGVDLSPTFYLSVLFVYAVSGISLCFFLRNIKKTIFTAVRNQTATTQLGRYFSPKIRDRIMSEEEANPLGEGQLQNVVVLFSDIRNFTSYCENNTPGDVVSFLRNYHSHMVNAIFKNGGTLDKFIGDGIMATFGTPTPSSDDALNSIKSAIKMSESLKEINEKRIRNGLSEIKHGIGIHYGPAIIGNVGSEDRLEYTVIGDTVNIASRLESSTKELNEEIIISNDLREMVRDKIKDKKKGSISLKGKMEPIEVVAVEAIL